jgi:hypothetical protein
MAAGVKAPQSNWDLQCNLVTCCKLLHNVWHIKPMKTNVSQILREITFQKAWKVHHQHNNLALHDSPEVRSGNTQQIEIQP